MASQAREQPSWWKSAIIYQIYPASFLSTTGGSTGTISGITRSLDYIKSLGVTALWLSPMYASPQVDMGYDISDYEAVHEPYGNVEDMEVLIEAAHQRGLKDHRPPNNWRSFFGESPWTYVDERGQWYLHLFEKAQPDLNWRNPAVRSAVYESAVRFWLLKGVDGFRVDAANVYSKDLMFGDAKITEPGAVTQPSQMHYTDGPDIHSWHRELRKRIEVEFGDRDVVLIGELHTSFEELKKYIGGKDDNRELDMVLDMSVIMLGGNWVVPKHEVRQYTLPEFKAAWEKIQGYPGHGLWTTVFMENHDQARSVSRFGSQDPKWSELSGKTLAMLLVTLSGTLFLYQGQEIGMMNLPEEWGISEFKDMDAVMYLRDICEKYPNDEEMLQRALGALRRLGRDNARTPMQWDNSTNAGFTTGSPWMRVNSNYDTINVATQQSDPDSLMNFWRRLLALRKQMEDLFVFGTFHLHNPQDERFFMYDKTSTMDGRTSLMVLNFTAEDVDWTPPPGIMDEQMQLLVSTVDEGSTRKSTLAAWEGRIYLVTPRDAP